MDTPSSNTQSTRVMAYLLDITGRRLQQLADEGVVKPIKRGTWDLVETVHGYIRYLRDGMKGPEDTHDARRERARLLKAQADKTETETAILRGEVIPAEVVKKAWGNMIGAFRARMLAVPSRAAAQVLVCTSFEDAEDILRGLIYEGLNELAEYNPYDYRHDGARASHLHSDDSDGSCATTTNSQSVGGCEPIPKPRVQRRTRKMDH